MTSESPATNLETFFPQVPDVMATDIAIIGAGMAGLYTALRLVEDKPERRITIVERLNRTGGRLQSDLVNVGEDTVREEEGGMRFNYGMTELMNLNKYLGLCDDIVPFPMGSEGQSNRFHVRGQTFTLAEAERGSNRIWGELFDLDESERGRSPSELIQGAFERVRRANDDSFDGKGPRPPAGPDGWGDVREKWKWQGECLNQWQLWGLLREMGYSDECIELVSSMNGFTGLFRAPINAGDAFQVLGDFPKHPQLFTFRRGFSTLPNAIASRLAEAHADNIQVLLSTNVDAIERNETGFSLSMTLAPDHANSSPFVKRGEPKTLKADKVVVAVATTGAQRLFQTSPALNSGPDAHQLWENLTAARGMALTKINLYFEEPWWNQVDGNVSPPVQFGPSFTSMPINSVYPFYSLPVPGKSETTEAAALTIYCDFSNTNFWAGLQNVGSPFCSPLQEEENNREFQTMFAASQPVVDEITRQLKVLFTVDSIPEPILTSYRLWDGTSDFEHAYHQWKVGVVDSTVRADLVNPIEGVYFCNEAISDMQAWVNGSLRSANLVLDAFDVPRMKDDPCLPPDDASLPAGRSAMPEVWG